MPDADLEALRRSLIEDACDDIIGVYEAWWSANTMWPAKPCSERLRLAEEAVVSALDDGLIGPEVGNWSDGTKPVPYEEARRLLLEWETWAIPDGPKVFMWRTDKGEQLVRGGPAGGAL